MLHGFVFKYSNFSHPTTSVLARPEHLHATALKPTHKAGRRGGGSIARTIKIKLHLILMLQKPDHA